MYVCVCVCKQREREGGSARVFLPRSKHEEFILRVIQQFCSRFEEMTFLPFGVPVPSRTRWKHAALSPAFRSARNYSGRETLLRGETRRALR